MGTGGDVKVDAGQKSRVEMSRIGGDVRLPDSFTVGRGARVDEVAQGKTGSERDESERGQNRTSRLSDWCT
jgi:hypothetical protein